MRYKSVLEVLSSATTVNYIGEVIVNSDDVVAEVKCNLYPISNDRAVREFGIGNTNSYVAYTLPYDFAEDITVKCNNNKYIIKSVMKWNNHCEVLLWSV